MIRALIVLLSLALVNACGSDQNKAENPDVGGAQDGAGDASHISDAGGHDAIPLPPPKPLKEGEWVVAWGTGDQAAEAQAIATDDEGNVYVAGAYAGTVDFGQGPTTSQGNYDIAVVSLTPEGALRWATTFPGTESQRAWSIDVAAGSVAIAGELAGTTSIGGASHTAQGTDALVVALDATNGGYLWHWVLGTGGSDYGYGVAVDTDGSVVATGTFRESITIGEWELRAGTFGSTFLARFSPLGELTLLNDLVGLFGRLELALGPKGLYLAGEYRGTYDFGGGKVSTNDATMPFLLALDSAHAFRWVEVGQGTDTSTVAALSVGPKGDPWIVGGVNSEMVFAGKTMLNLDVQGTSFIAHLGAEAGAPALVDKLDGLGGEYLVAIDASADGQVYLAGTYSRTFERGDTKLTARSDNDLLVLCLNSDGGVSWARGFGGPGTPAAAGVAAGAHNDVFVMMCLLPAPSATLSTSVGLS